MSEHLPEIPERRVAQDIVEQAGAYLELHSEAIDIMQRYAVALPNDYVLELRVSGGMGKAPRNDSRYIYITDHSDKCGVDFSLDLNSLSSETADVKGLTQHFYHIGPALEGAREGYADEKELLGCLLRLMLHYDQTNHVEAEHYAELEAAFIDVLANGSTWTEKRRVIKVSDEIYVGMRSRSLEGDPSHAWPMFIEMPAVSVLVTEKSKDKQTVLESYDEGLMETFGQQANPMARAAALAKPEDITRDKNGKIIGFSLYGDAQAMVKEAERAAGIRELDMTQILFIQKHLNIALGTTEL
ncbi:MAG TPA: hypothetical protein VD947_00225 [Patescibacteria group bacterium]|nr:hypothetical protein [Patescibacteria group bacterium]